MLCFNKSRLKPQQQETIVTSFAILIFNLEHVVVPFATRTAGTTHSLAISNTAHLAAHSAFESWFSALFSYAFRAVTILDDVAGAPKTGKKLSAACL